jgi:hypothetical protein
MDRDILNATITATDAISFLGSEAMGLFPWANEVMPDAMFYQKPWDRITSSMRCAASIGLGRSCQARRNT